MSGFKVVKGGVIGKHGSDGKITGVKKSIKYLNFQTSTGIPSLNEMIGGGILTGSIVLFEEDLHRTYAHLLIRLFVAEGIKSKHGLFYCFPDVLFEDFLKNIPDEVEFKKEESVLVNDLEIAWKYQKLNVLEKSDSSKPALGGSFDLSKCMDNKDFNTKDVNAFEFLCDVKKSLEENIAKLLMDIGTYLNGPSSNNVQRIVITSFGSLFYGYTCRSNSCQIIVSFLTALRLLTRETLAVVYITIPRDIFNLPGFSCRASNCADYTYRLEGFDGRSSDESMANPVYQEYSGLFTVYGNGGLPWPGVGSTGSLEPVTRPVTLDWAFKVKRTQFIIQHLFLPPSLSETASRSSASESVLSKRSEVGATGSCGSGSGFSPIDF